MDDAEATRSIDEIVSTLSGEPFSYCANPGNAGDALIAQATFQAFDRHGLRYQIILPTDEVPPGRIIVYAGGGNLVRYYSVAAEFIARVHRHAKRLVLLPHTIEGHETLLAQFGPNVELVCRERVSYDYVRKAAPGCKALLSEDMALTFDVEDALRLRALDMLPSRSDPLLPWNVLRFQIKRFLVSTRYREEARRLRGAGPTEEPGSREVNCFRTDIEGAGLLDRPELQGRPNIDISNALMCRTSSTRAFARWSSSAVLRFLDQYDVVNTDRLHVCIGALLMKKSVRLYGNNYFKIRAIYEHSLSGRYPGLIWMG